MQTSASEFFFLDTATGKRLCLLRKNQALADSRAVIIFIQAFGEEMNRSRRMATLQAQQLIQLGFAVVIMDFCGTGDSEGELANTTWQTWKSDLQYLCSWIRERTDSPICLLGLRLGALLAIDFSGNHDFPIRRTVLWQPVFDGEQYFSEFFRTHLMTKILNVHNNEKIKEEKTDSLKNSVNQTVEISGYEISPTFKQSVISIKIEQFEKIPTEVTWIEIDRHLSAALSKRRQHHQFALREIAQQFDFIKCQGEQFWNTQEISVCTELIDVTSTIFCHAYRS
ncbi:MAG: hydrolase 2, exosortase A system-associated [Burkholderiaceae bacterium]|nr:hydrolase 2, exosortase A system-associated [Burkholderiaceae bacterium]